MDSSCVFLALTLSLCFLNGVYGWGYFGADNEDHWKDTNPFCDDTEQSPINIITKSAVYESFPKFTLTDFDTTTSLTLKLENNGHTAKLSPIGVAPKVTGGGLSTEYTMAQLHFHWGETSAEGSEHQIDGTKFPLEMHIVTYKSSHGGANAAALADREGLAVLGFFFQIGTVTHPAFQKIVDDLGSISASGSSANMTSVFKIEDLMPSTFNSFYRYNGSLTTPTCDEAVVWTVFADTVKITEAQLNALRALQMSETNDANNYNMYNNYRTPQALNGRKVLTNLFVNSGLKPTVNLSVLLLPLISFFKFLF